MKEQEQENLEIIDLIISKEAKRKSFAVLEKLSEKRKTFKITGFKKKCFFIKGEEITSYVFCFTTDYIPDVVFEAPMSLFTRNLFDADYKRINNTNLHIINSLNVKIAYLNELEIQPTLILCKIEEIESIIHQGKEIKQKTKIDGYAYLFEIKTK